MWRAAPASLAFTTVPAATLGNTIIACVSQTTASFSNPTDDVGNVYTLARSQIFNSRPQICWHSIGIRRAATTFSVTPTTTSLFELYLAEYSDIVQIDRVTGGSLSSTATGPAPMSVAAALTACDNELAVLYCASSGTTTMANTYTIRSTFNADAMGDAVLPTARTSLTAAGSSSTSFWGCIQMLFQLPSSCATIASTTTLASTTTTPFVPSTSSSANGGGAPTVPPNSNACCGGLFPSATCSTSNVCQVTGVSTFPGGSFTALKTVTAPPTAASPLVVFGDGPVALSGTLTVTLYQNALNNTQYVLLTAAIGTSFSGAFQSV